MNAIASSATAGSTHVDVLIVGAGLGGIGSAVHLTKQCPEKTYAILEMKDTFGGTWVTHQYPGIRSDSDLYTYGYSFKPWVGPPIASGQAIIDYLGEVIDEYGLASHLRYGHRITRAEWSSEAGQWSVSAIRADGTSADFTCTFLWMCQGYYDHENPYMPEWPGMGDFAGLLVHAQSWDPATDYSGKRVVVIGSGASAATIVPAMAERAARVTMLQRSPTYFLAAPNANELADRLRLIGVDEPTIHRIVRQSVNYDHKEITRRCREEPDAVIAELKEAIRAYAGPDIVIAATGFRLKVMGGIAFSVDGQPVNFADTISWRGMMFSGVPNLAWMMVYFRNAATLRVELIGEFVCRLLKHMEVRGAKRAEVRVPDELADLPRLPWIEPDNFNPNYLLRDLEKLPGRLDRPEWQDSQDYERDRVEWPQIDLDGSEFVYDGVRAKDRVTEAA
ncbi:MAG: NAD(P)/FAD-dependent oxidoreductase [Novosphingobium sp.]|nr:NAD(P)/FAD-dependent oxidoreductase [Novosphingobium sp.]